MKKLFIIILIILPIIGYVADSQITVYPNLVFIDPVSRSGYIRLVNSGEVPMEVEIVSEFSYKNADSTSTKKDSIDILMETRHSLLKYLKIFPKRLVVQPKKDQMIRFLVMHPPNISDGTYTSTITFISQPIKKQLDTTDKKNIQMGMVLKTGIISMVIYQKGKLTTSVDLTDFTTSLDTANLNLIFSIDKSGNSPYWGKAKISILDTKGMVVDTVNEPFGIYCASKKSFKVNKNKFKSGKYTAEISINTTRPDIPEDRTIKVATLVKRFEFTLP